MVEIFAAEYKVINGQYSCFFWTLFWLQHFFNDEANEVRIFLCVTRFFFTSNAFFQLRLIFSLAELHMLLRCCLIHLLIHVVYLVYLCPYLDLYLFMSYLYDLFFIFIVIIFSVIIITHIISLQQTPIRAWCCL